MKNHILFSLNKFFFRLWRQNCYCYHSVNRIRRTDVLFMSWEIIFAFYFTTSYKFCATEAKVWKTQKLDYYINASESVQNLISLFLTHCSCFWIFHISKTFFKYLTIQHTIEVVLVPFLTFLKEQKIWFLQLGMSTGSKTRSLGPT